MKEITFNAVYRGKRSRFVISEVSGGGGAWHLLIDNYYFGSFAFIGDRWIFLPQNDDYFTPEQVAILEGQLTKHQAKAQ